LNRVLLIGWDAADWKVIQPLLQAGRMPNLARLMAGGVHGNLATLYPVLSPMLWTSIATGKRAYKHGIHGFCEPLPDGSGVRPITLLSRKTKAIWNILNQTGRRSLVVGWWPSHPAEPLTGVMVSNHFPLPAGEPRSLPPLPPGAVHPAALAETLRELRVNPMELTGEFLRYFVPDYEKVDQSQDKRLHTLGKVIAETMSIHAVATELLSTQSWDFAAIYYSGLDHFGHAFMNYHPPRLPWISEDDFAIYQPIVANAYCYHDAMLGALLEHADADTSVILMSDHGFHPDHLRPGYIPVEPAGPAVEHRHFGILCMKGPSLRVSERIFGASLLDICPTLLTMFGLPAGKDMDGKVLVTAFQQPPVIELIESWDDVPGDAGTHPAEMQLDSVASAQAFKQLADLGYVAPPAANTQEAVEESTRELKYNLARAYRDGNCCGEAAALAEELWTRWPKEHRFGILLVDCLGALREVARRRTALEELGRRIERYQAEARAELVRREQAAQNLEASATTGGKDMAPPTPEQQHERYEMRQLRELAHGRPLLMEWLLVTQALLEKRPAEARRLLEELAERNGATEALGQRIAGALAELGELEPARALLEQALESDPEDALIHSQLAAIHFEAGRFAEAISSAAESLSLLYFQPGIHALLGQALLETRRFAEAERELQVAVAQSPRNLAAHEALGHLYRQHLHRPADAFAHEGRALSLRNELAARIRPSERPSVKRGATQRAKEPSNAPRSYVPTHPLTHSLTHRLAHAPTLVRSDAFTTPDPARIITIVSGLPRSGTSLMMQLLAAAGRETLSDAKRAADEDNPLGYFELEKTLELAKDVSWLPSARGKVVKIVAQLLPMLPRNEHYQLIFMQRDLNEVIASQRAMLARRGVQGASLGEAELATTFADQLERVLRHLEGRREFRALLVDYGELVAEPVAAVERVADFVGAPFDRAAAARSVRPELRRQKAA
jgi:predicted AlkP superfamily phosphohydrolase/phosphomutase/tetratricopeptide (TPR) repeat protein